MVGKLALQDMARGRRECRRECFRGVQIPSRRPDVQFLPVVDVSWTWHCILRRYARIRHILHLPHEATPLEYHTQVGPSVKISQQTQKTSEPRTVVWHTQARLGRACAAGVHRQHWHCHQVRG